MSPNLIPSPGSSSPNSGQRLHPRLRGLLWATVALVVCFGWPLFHLARFALGSSMYSHIPLIPLISAYLVWWKRQSLPAPGPRNAHSELPGTVGPLGERARPATGRANNLNAPNEAAGNLQTAPDRWFSIACYLVGVLALGGYAYALLSGEPSAAPEDALALTTLCFLLLFAGLCGLFLGRSLFRAVLFPLGFLVFMIPFPTALMSWIDTNLQIGSAVAARGFFSLAGTPYFYHDLVFKLPDISIRVAPECSGIHSSLALLITSVLAAYLFLRTPWKQATLALFVIPLGMLRNGFRVFVIGELCVHVGPQMINSWIHHKGGPIFFVLALVPFFLLLYWLYRSDRRKVHQGGPANPR